MVREISKVVFMGKFNNQIWRKIVIQGEMPYATVSDASFWTQMT